MSFQVYQAQGLRIYTGDTATVNSYVGLAGELAINTETKSVRILDGLNPGGVPLSTAGGVELQGLNIEQLANLLVSSPQDGRQGVRPNQPARLRPAGDRALHPRIARGLSAHARMPPCRI